MELASRYRSESSLASINQLLQLSPSPSPAGAESPCCPQLQLTAPSSLLYPRIAGSYSRAGAGSSSRVYSSSGGGLFLSHGGTNYTWGVNNNPDKRWAAHRSSNVKIKELQAISLLARWGWVRAVGDALCPEQVAAWAVYDQERRRWAQDPAFSVRCLL